MANCQNEVANEEELYEEFKRMFYLASFYVRCYYKSGELYEMLYNFVDGETNPFTMDKDEFLYVESAMYQLVPQRYFEHHGASVLKKIVFLSGVVAATEASIDIDSREDAADRLAYAVERLMGFAQEFEQAYKVARAENIPQARRRQAA